MTTRIAEHLTQHYVTAIECDHEAKTDTVRCSCSAWTGTPQPSVGAAVRQWADHVFSEGAAPRAEGLREALEHVLDVWPAPSPEEFARLHRVLTGHDSCSSRPSDEQEPNDD